MPDSGSASSPIAKPAVWRAVLLTLCAAGILLVVVAFFDQAGLGGARPWYGMWSGYFAGSAAIRRS